MTDIDPQFFNEGGSINYQAAEKAARKARSDVAYEGAGWLRQTVQAVWGLAVSGLRRVPLHISAGLAPRGKVV